MENAVKYPGTRWFVLLTVFFSYFGLGMMIVAFSPIVGLIADEFKITPGEISFYAIGIYTIANAISVIIAGVLFDKFGVKPVLFAGALLSLIGAILVPLLSYSVAGIIIARVIIGLGGGPVAGCIANIAAQWFPVRERGTFNGVVGAGISLGIMVSFIQTGARLTATHGDWRAAMATLVIGPAIGMVFVIIMMIVAKESSLPQMEEFHVDSSASHDFAYVVKSPIFYLIIFATACYAWVMSSFNDLTPGYLAIPAPVGIGIAPTAVGLFMSLVQVGNIVGALASGILVDRVFKGNAKPVIAGAFLLIFITSLSIKFPFVYGNTGLFGVMLFLTGYGIASIMPCISNFIATNMPNTIIGKVFSTAFGISLIVGAIGVSAGSAALHFTGTYQLPIIIVSIVALIGFFPALFFYKPKRFHVKEERTISAS